MGAWGYGYKDGDDYYNAIPGFVGPLVQALRETLESGETERYRHLREHLLWTVGMMSKTSETVTLSREEVAVFRKAVERVRAEALLNAAGWKEPVQFLATVEQELTGVEAWLDGFEPMGFLGDRIGALGEALGGEEHA